MSSHRGLLHHMNIKVSNLKRSAPFYAAVLGNLGYEQSGSYYGADYCYEDWKRWDSDSPHEIGIGQADPQLADLPYKKGAMGHHDHIAFCALDRADVDRFHAEVLVPLAEKGLCTIEDPPCDCPEYGEGYYATFFHDPDGLKYEFVFNPNHLRKARARRSANQAPPSSP